MSGFCADPAGSVGAFLCRAGQHLRAAGIENPRLEARLLLGHAMGVEAIDLLRDPRRPVPTGAASRFGDLLRRRLDRVPIAHLTGVREFWSLPIQVSPATLIPRPDSETLIEAALATFPDRTAVRTVLDLGTGTGCLLLAALTEFDAAEGVGVDHVPEAAALARENAHQFGLAGRARLVVGCWAASLASQFDLVLCNPPYVTTAEMATLDQDVARYEPASALDGGSDGLDAYRAVIADLRRLLAPDGRAILELGQGQASAVSTLSRAAGLDVIALRPDLGGVGRALILAPSCG
jgi:release factor glutamine methyltransferase